MPPNLTLHSVLAILILTADTIDPALPPTSTNHRLYAKYYSAPHQPSQHHLTTSPTSLSSLPSLPRPQPYSTLKDQRTFEKGLLEKTAKQTSDVILYDGKIVVFKMESDVMMYVVGDAGENEVLLYNVVLCLRDSLSILLKNATSRLTILESYDLVTLAADEIVDDGIILETDPVIVASRVSKAPAQDAPNMKNLDLSEQGLLNIWEFAKKKGVEAVRNNL